MIRSKTTLVVGAGAGCEIGLPDGKELLGKIAQGFDFPRLGSDLQTPDMQMLAKHFEVAADRLGTSQEKMFEAAQSIRTSARVGTSIDAILEQHGHDAEAVLAGKLAIVHYTLQAEARSALQLEPRHLGELPVRGRENWLFQLGQMLTSGVPRSKAESCFDNLTIVSFNYDRSIQHYLPFVFSMAFGMPLAEARELVGERIKIVHPYGSAGRLPWEPGKHPDAEWGDEEPYNLQKLVGEIRTASECHRNPEFLAALRAVIAGSKRIVVLGFGFDPQNVEILFGEQQRQKADVLCALTGVGDPTRAAIMRTLRQRMGIEDNRLISVLDLRCYQLLRDYSLFLES